MTETTDDPFHADLPSPAKERAFAYHTTMGVPQSQAKVAALRDFGYPNKDIADLLDKDPDTTSGYYSKFGRTFDEGQMLFLSSFGFPKMVRGWDLDFPSNYDEDQRYIIKPLLSPADAADATKYPPEGAFMYVRIIADRPPSEHETPTFKMESQSYESLDALADDLYRHAEFGDLREAEQMRAIITETGMPEDKLPDPRRQLPADHPDGLS